MKNKITTTDIKKTKPYMKTLISELEKIVGSRDFNELTKRENIQKLYDKYNKVNELFVDIIGQKEFGVGDNYIDVYDKNLEDQIHQLPPKQHTMLIETLRCHLLNPVLVYGGVK